ncbi:transcriptional adapter 2B isoform X2 [Frankliniella occidentalis]|nr:transcriptional adapter 2B isoform X2 [Frankliniella occidentalis]
MFAKAQCNYCQEDVSGIRVKCAECTDFEICLQCFSAGAEIGQHKNNHSYQFKDSGAVGILLGKNGWTAKEEQHLLDAIEQYGFGNWEDISRHIETRTPDEAREEYINRYLEGNIGKATWNSAANSRPLLTEISIPDDGPLSPEQINKLPPLDITPDEAAQLGYMPLRDDFEKEFDNDAEALVSPLSIHPVEDDELDIALKLAQVDMYTRRLRERARRKRVGRDYQLVANFFQPTTRKDRPVFKKKLPRDEREFQDHMRVLTQFHSSQEHEQFLAGVRRQRELEVRINELLRYRRHGITTVEECHHFEQLRQEIRDKRRNSDSCNVSLSPLSAQSKRREKGGSFSIIKKSTSMGNDRCLFPVSPDSGTEGGGEADSDDTLAADTPQDVAALPGYPLLSKDEAQLCTTLKITPNQYYGAKYSLLEMHVNKGSKKEDGLTLSEVCTLDGEPLKHIFNYMVESGWISAG